MIGLQMSVYVYFKTFKSYYNKLYLTKMISKTFLKQCIQHEIIRHLKKKLTLFLK